MKNKLDDQMGEASGSLMKKKTSDDQKEETDGAISSKSTLDDQKGEASGVMIKRKSALDDQEGEASGALLLKKTKWQGHVWPPRRMLGRSKFERIESIAKEGVGQSKICSGIHPRLEIVSCPKEDYYLFLFRA